MDVEATVMETGDVGVHGISASREERADEK